MGCKLYIRNRLVGVTVEEQVQWVLSHVQGELANIWKENILEDLEEGVIEYELVEVIFDGTKKRVWWWR